MTTPTVEVALAERHRDRFGQIQARAVELTDRAWLSLDDWTSPGAAERWAALWLPIGDAAVAAAMGATDAYFALAVSGEALDVQPVSAAALRGVPSEQYARRPLAELYRRLGEGALWDQAFSAARDRLSAMTATDVALGQRRAAADWAESGRIVGYRRTLTGRSCALCAVASTQRYTRGNLAPIHQRCDCGLAPITGSEDPGRVINEQLLDDLQQASNRSDYWRDRDVTVDDGRVVQDDDRFVPKVRQHGELGPVLVAPDDKFTGPSVTN